MVLALAALMLTASCTGAESPGEQETTTAAGTEPPAAVADAPLITAEKTTQFRVVRPDGVYSDETDEAKKIVERMGALTVTPPQLVSDFLMPDEKAGEYEILIGLTNRPESTEAKMKTPYGSYSITFSPGRVVIFAHDSTGLRTAVERFCILTENRAKASGGEVKYSEDDSMNITQNRLLSVLPVSDKGKLDLISDRGDGCYMAILSGKGIFDDYIAKFPEAGFTPTGSRTDSNGNAFASFERDGNAYYVYYTAYTTLTRIIAEPLSNTAAADDRQYTATVTPQLTVIGKRYSTTDTYRGKPGGKGLMCMVLRLPDNSFIVIDSGLNAAYADEIYKTVSAGLPAGTKPVIAAWLITHAHTDHTGGFIAFTGKYASGVTLERLVFNFPTAAETGALGTGLASAGTIRDYLTGIYSGVDFIKAHNGQILSIHGTEVEIVCSPEDYITKTRGYSEKGAQENDTCVSFMVHLAGQKLFFPGDPQETQCNLMGNMYGDLLKSDILQVVHHGGSGGTTTLYKYVRPSLAIFTTSDELFELYKTDAHNKFLIELDSIKEVVNNADRVLTFNLPYAKQ